MAKDKVKEPKLKQKMTAAQKNEAIWGLAFVTPTMLGLIILNFYPIVDTIIKSFQKVGKFNSGNTFVGLDNYKYLLVEHSSDTLRVFWNTIKYAIIEVPFGVAIALLLAVLLNRKMHGRTIYRTIFFMPMVCAPAAVAMVWKWLYNTKYGLLNNLFGTEIEWISNGNIAWIFIAIIGVWSIIGYNMVLFLSGLQEIPHDYYEAAEIDGATGVKQFFKITVPLLSPTTFFIVQTRIIGALTVFDLMYMVMDKTNKAFNQVEPVVYWFYDLAFQQNNKGLGSALVVVLLIFIMIITVILQKSEKKLVFYN